MPDNAPGGGGTPADAATGSGNPDINELINIAVGKRVKKAVEKAMDSLRGDLASVVKETMAQQFSKPGDKPQDGQLGAPSNSAQEQERLTLKALQDQIEREKKARLDMENRFKEADQRAKSERMRSEVMTRAASKFGADSPLLPMWMSHFYDGQKRVVEQDGSYFVKFKDAIGDDELVPISDGFARLFDKEGEFHGLIQPQSKAAGLPPRTVRANGTAAGGHEQQNGQTPMSNHPIYGVVANHLRSVGEGDKAAALDHVVSLHSNGQSEK